MSQIEFPQERAMLLDIASRTLRSRWTVEQVRDHLEHGRGYDDGLYEELHELGWSSLTVPVDAGGAGQPLGALVPLVEPMGRHLLAGPFVTTQIALQGLLATSGSAARDGYIQSVVQGEHLALALLEEDGSWNLDAPATTFHQSSEGTAVLRGQKIFVQDLAVASAALVSATAENGELVLLVIDRPTIEAARQSTERLIDLTRRSCTVHFDGLAVGDALILRGASAQRSLCALQEAAWLLSAAEACGGLQGVLEVLLEYLKQRTQFGRHIGSYQALKHPTVDILIGLERSRSLLYRAATLVSQSEANAKEREIALRMAKAEADRAFVFAGDRAIQFHGGVGFTWECDAQLFLRRALWSQAQWGDPQHHRQRLADLIC